MPVETDLEFEIEALDSDGEVVIKTMLKLEWMKSLAQEDTPTLSVPITAVVLYSGVVYTESEISKLQENYDEYQKNLDLSFEEYNYKRFSTFIHFLMMSLYLTLKGIACL